MSERLSESEEELRDSLASALGSHVAADAARPVVHAYTAGVIADLARHLADVGVIPKPLPTDPRARALELRRTRNTGPARKPAGQSKRPRSL